MSDISPRPSLGHKSTNSIGLSFNATDNAPTTVDLSDDLPPRSNGGLTPRVVSPRPDDSSSFTSSTLASHQTQHRGNLPRLQTERGFIAGTPPTPGSEPITPYSEDGKKEPPAYSDSPYTNNFPLSGGSNGVASHANGGERSSKPHFTDSTAYWLGMYFFFNLGLTLFNKVVLVSFPFAYVSLLRLCIES